MNTSRLDQTQQLRPVPLKKAGAISTTAINQVDKLAEPLAYDVYGTYDALLIEFDVPGIDARNIQVSLDNQVLTVKAERQISGAELVDVIEKGRSHGSFERQLLLPGQWDTDKLEASLSNGVLKVTAPWKKTVEKKQIQVTDEAIGTDAPFAFSLRDGAAA